MKTVLLVAWQACGFLVRVGVLSLGCLADAVPPEHPCLAAWHEAARPGFLVLVPVVVTMVLVWYTLFPGPPQHVPDDITVHIRPQGSTDVEQT